VLAQEFAALAQQDRVAHRRFDRRQRCAGQGQQVDMHPHEGFIDDMQPRAGQQRMDVGNPAVG
jgi:hypothetical protein